MKIKIKYHQNPKKMIQHGKWMNLFQRRSYRFKAPSLLYSKRCGNIDMQFDTQFVDLGISMALPKYFEANIIPRSSAFIKQSLIIDSDFSGEQDIWRFPAIALKEIYITPIKAICQFRIQPTMNAPWWIKLKWIFISKVKFIEVDVLNGVNRRNFDSTD